MTSENRGPEGKIAFTENDRIMLIRFGRWDKWLRLCQLSESEWEHVTHGIF